MPPSTRVVRAMVNQGSLLFLLHMVQLLAQRGGVALFFAEVARQPLQVAGADHRQHFIGPAGRRARPRSGADAWPCSGRARR